MDVSGYYELPYAAECPECGTPMHEPECLVCAEADWHDELCKPTMGIEWWELAA